MNVLIKVIIFYLALISLAGCSTEANDDTYLFFKIEGENENLQNYGSLFVKKEDSEPTLIAENVLESSFEYFDETEQILFIDNLFDLYVYDGVDGTSKIAEGVQAFNGNYLDEGKIFYSDLDHEVHVYGDGADQALTLQSSSYELIDDLVYMADDDANFKVFDLDSGNIEQIDEDVSTFKFLDKEKNALITDLEGALFYYDFESRERIPLDDGYVFLSNVTVADDTVYYIQTTGMFQSLLKKVVLDDQIESELIAEAKHYRVVNGWVYFQNQEGMVIKWNSETNDVQEKVWETSLYWHVTPRGDVVSLSLMDGLLWNDELKASNLNYFYSYWNGKVVYAVGDTLYRLDEGGHEQTVMDDVSDYDAVYYNNSPVYFNRK